MHTIHVDLQASDVVYALLSLHLRPATLGKAWLIWTFVVGAILVALRGLPSSEIDVAILAVASTGGAIGSLIFALAFNLIRAVLVVRKAHGVLGTHEFALTNEGIWEKTSANESLVKWLSIKSIRATGRAFLIELPMGSLHIIPFRAFADKAECEHFLHEFKRLAANAI
jgi:hypothetical protein